MAVRHLVTVEELERMGAKDFELVRGEVMVHRPGYAVVTLSAIDTLDGGEVLPGFTLPLARLFAELD